MLNPESPRVTIVVPCYNAAGFVEQAVSSIEAQSYSQWLVTLIDDGSTDSTFKVLDGIRRRLGSKARVLRGKNRGACHARNWAVRDAKTEYVAFLDADDIWHPEKLRLQVAAMTTEPRLIGVTSAYRLYDPDRGKVSEALQFQWSRKELINWTLLGRRAPGLNSTLFVKRDAVIRVGGFDENLGSHADDLDLAWRLAAWGPIGLVGDDLALLRVSEAQAHRDYRSMGRSLSLVFEKLSDSPNNVSNNARGNLKIYLSVKALLESRVPANFLRLIGLFLLQPFKSSRFFWLKITDSRRLALRIPDSALSDFGWAPQEKK